MSSIPKKGDIIINPKTSRPVKVGSRTWLNLVKEGLVDGHYKDSKQLGVIDEKYTTEEVEEKIREVNKRLPPNRQAVRGRGKYKGKLVSRKKQLNTVDTAKAVARSASRAVNNNLDELIESGDDFQNALEQLILQEMMNDNSVVNKRSKPINIPNKENYYEVKEDNENEYEYDDDEGLFDEEFNEDDYFE